MVRRILLTLSAILFLIALPANAAAIYQCSFNAGAFTTSGCYSQTAFVATNDFLDWGASTAAGGFGVALSSGANKALGNDGATTWDGFAYNNNALGVKVGVNPATYTAAPVLQRADNAAYIVDGTGLAIDTVPSTIRTYIGDFSAPPIASTQSTTGAGTYYGDHLMGLTDSSSPLVITFTGGPVYAVGFRVSSRDQNPQIPGSGEPSLSFPGATKAEDVIVTAYHNGVAVLSYELQAKDGFGTCPGLNNPDGNGDIVPCNSAYYVGIDTNNTAMFGATAGTYGAGWITSISINSMDTAGFYIDQLQIQDQAPVVGAPEPGTTVLIGSGLILAAMLARKRAAAKHSIN